MKQVGAFCGGGWTMWRSYTLVVVTVTVVGVTVIIIILVSVLVVVVVSDDVMFD